MRTRFAPSPTGDMHLGGLRTALYSYALARQSGGSFAIRIEDSDAKRTVAGAEERLLSALARCGLEHDGAVVKQSTRLPLYRQHADHLVKTHAAYCCFCSAGRLDSLRKMQEATKQPTQYDGLCSHLSASEAEARVLNAEPYTIRMRAPKTGETVVHDAVVGAVRFDNRTMDDQVLVKSDGWPTYHLASVVDDHAMRVTHVVRGDEWLPSTPKHLALYSMFKWSAPSFAHLPLLRNPDGTKLSKRKGALPVLDLLDAGYLPSALLNFCALLGWSPPPDAALRADHVLSLADFVRLFSLKHVTRSAAIADPKRLKFFNTEHLRCALAAGPHDAEFQLAERHVLNDLRQRGIETDNREYVRAVMHLLNERAHDAGDFVRFGLHLFQAGVPEEDLANFPKHVLDDPKQAMRIVQAALAAGHDVDWDVLPASLGLPKGDVLSVLRWALTGLAAGAPVPATARILGSERVKHRLQTAGQALVQLVIFAD